jgi:hypothetical protein
VAFFASAGLIPTETNKISKQKIFDFDIDCLSVGSHYIGHSCPWLKQKQPMNSLASIVPPASSASEI